MNFLITNYNNPLLKKIYDILIYDNKSTKFIDEHIQYNTIKKFIVKHKINIIIHSDTISDIDECEKLGNEALTINKSSINTLTKLCNELNITLIYLSSHEVYGNSTTNVLDESSSCTPINILGTSQKSSELLISNSCDKFFILRLSWIFGLDNCYIKQIISNAKTPLMFCSEKVVNPTSVKFVVQVMHKLITTTHYGLYNCASSNFCSKLELTKFIFDFIDFPKEVLPFPDTILNKFTKTANLSALNINSLKETFSINIPDYENEIKNYINSNFK
ncbi:MAG: sugar nucleotide-binding protein [Sarcina sp.]